MWVFTEIFIDCEWKCHCFDQWHFHWLFKRVTYIYIVCMYFLSLYMYQYIFWIFFKKIPDIPTDLFHYFWSGKYSLQRTERTMRYLIDTINEPFSSQTISRLRLRSLIHRPHWMKLFPCFIPIIYSNVKLFGRKHEHFLRNRKQAGEMRWIPCVSKWMHRLISRAVNKVEKSNELSR